MPLKKLYRKFYRIALVFVAGLCLLSQPAFAQSTDQLPSFDNPKLVFGTGKVVNNQPEVSSIYPEIAGDHSGWTVVQWNQETFLSGTEMKINALETKNSEFGTANYDFTAPDGHSHVWVYMNGPNHHPVYDLYEQGGKLTSAGGSNIFLSANTINSNLTLDRPLILSLSGRISEAKADYQTPEAKSSGAVLGQAFIGFVMSFPFPEAKNKNVLFLQIPLTNSRNTARFQVGCKIVGDHLRLLAGGTLNNSLPFSFAASAPTMRELSFNLADYVRAVLKDNVTCRSATGNRQVNFSAVPLKNVTVGRVYIGLETENRDERPGAKDFGATQGNVAIGLQLSNVQLRYTN